MKDTFGELIRKMRLKKGSSLRGMAADIGIAPSYLSDLEHDKRYPPTGELLDKVKCYLCLSADDEYYFYDLVGLGRGEVAPDMTEFLRRNELIRGLVRKFMEISDDVGDKLIDFEDEYITILETINSIKKKIK